MPRLPAADRTGLGRRRHRTPLRADRPVRRGTAPPGEPRRVAVETPPLTDEESVLVDDLEGEIEDLVAELEDEETSDDARTNAEAKIRALNERVEAIVSKPPIIDDELKPKVGAFLILD